MPEIMIFNELFNEDVPSSPSDRDYGTETGETLQSRVALAPQLRQLNYFDSGANAAANTNALEAYLFGYSDPGGELIGYKDDMGKTYSVTNSNIYERNGDLFYGEKKLSPFYSEAINQEGMATLYPRIVPMVRQTLDDSKRWQVASEVGLLNEYGPQYREAMLKLNPEAAKARDMMWDDTLSGLESGSNLSPAEEASYARTIRSGQASRGLGFGPMDAFTEMLEIGKAGENRKNQRMSQAQQMTAYDQSLLGDPFMQLLGRPSGADANANALMGVSGSASLAGNQGMFNTESGYASDLYNTNYNAGWSNVYNVRNNNAANTAAFMQLMGSVMGAGSNVGGAAMGCWVAREVYGEGNPKWLVFREWLFNEAPGWFRGIYCGYGERFAGWIRNKPRVKGWIRRWMDGKIKRRTSNVEL